MGPAFIDSQDDLLRKTASKECKYSIVMGSAALHAIMGRYCGILIQAGEAFLEGGVSFVLPRGSPLTEDLNNATLQLNEEGALSTVLYYLIKQQRCPLYVDPKLDFARLRVFFYSAFVVCFLFFIGMVHGSHGIWTRKSKNERIENSLATENQEKMKDFEPGGCQDMVRYFCRIYRFRVKIRNSITSRLLVKT